MTLICFIPVPPIKAKDDYTIGYTGMKSPLVEDMGQGVEKACKASRLSDKQGVYFNIRDRHLEE
jgi:hypothetical protein